VTATSKSRAHLVERAVQAMGAGGMLGLRRAPQAEPPPAAGQAAPGPAEPAATAGLAAETPTRGAPPVEPSPDASPKAPAPAPLATPAAVPHEPVPLPMLRSAGLVAMAGAAGRTRLSEEIALVQQQVLRTMRGLKAEEGRASRVVLVTSARPGEGKTFTALNLAAAVASGGGYPTILVDADGKKGSVSELLGCRGVLGLHALALQPERDPHGMLLPTAIPRLSLISYGSRPPGIPDEVANVPPGTQLAQAVLRLAQAFPKHMLILDSPPCLATSDPGSLAAVAGQVLMVVQAEKTQRNELEAALDMVEPCPVLQLVLNRTHLTSNDSFGAYGYGAYGAYGGNNA
jgi:receptor protein-tyrosine kinase